MQELGTRPGSFISGNICFEFLVQCLCSASSKIVFSSLILCIWVVGILAVASGFAGDSVVAGLHAFVDVPDIACVLGVSDVLILLLAFLP